MSKVICDVCGTSYPETATQCPICGSVRPADAQGVSGDGNDASGAGTYNYVKGGRFSKANVRKRNKANQQADTHEEEPSADAQEEAEEAKSGKGLVITAVILLLAIVAVVIYIALRFFQPFLPDTNEPKDTEASTGGETTELTVPCEAITLHEYEITLTNGAGSAVMLYATPTPADTTDVITYSSSDESVATVSDNGKITAVAPGEAVITVACGEISAQCTVVCDFELPTEDTTEETTEETTEDTTASDETLSLNRSDITFSSKGSTWMIYSGKIAKNLITWSSDDETVATIKNGTVTAVGSGMTKVYAEYNGQKVSCIIRCVFADETANQGVSGSGGGVSEDGAGAASTGNVTISHTDVTLKLNVAGGNSFTLTLKDGSTVLNVTWTSADSSVCTVSGNTVTAVGSGTTTVSATYNGTTYSCTVRVS